MTSKMRDFITFIALCYVLVLADAKSKYVSVNLDAKWQSTPILLEASEFLASEGNDKFWGFLNRVTELNPDLVLEESDEAMYNLVQKFSSRFLTPMMQNFQKMFLSLRAFSPTVEMYQQVATDVGPPSDCDAFVDIHGQKTCDVGQVDVFIEQFKDRSAPNVFKFDHIYPGSRDGPVTVILYAELGTHAAKDFHQKLSALANEKKIAYIYRHYIVAPSEDRTRLSGYGVELAIKSTEYKAKDDTKVEGDQGEVEEEDDPDSNVEGFVFAKLKERHPDLKDDLKKFKVFLQDSSTELQAFKVWQLQDLSLQAAQKVLSADAGEALQLLRDISQNFPSVARSLIKTSVSEDVKKEIVKNNQYFENYHGISPGDSALFLNGIGLDMDVYDIFTFLDLMKSEATIMEGLFTLGFKGEDMYKFLQIDTGGKQEFALDIRHGAVQYINDLEKDDKYKGWPDRAQDILRPTYPGMMRHVAKNFFNLVFIVDPTDSVSIELLKMAESFYVHSVPFRMGLVFVVNPDRSISGEKDAGVALANVYDYLRQEESAPKALSFITDVYEVAKSEDITAEMVIQEFTAQFPDEEVEKVFGADTEYDYIRKSGTDFVTKSGLRDFPQVLLNGKPLKKSYLTQDEFEEGVVMEIMQATPEIQQAVYQGKLHDSHDTLEWLMERDNVLPRMNSRVLSPAEQTLDLSENIAESGLIDDLNTFQILTAKDMSGIVADNMKYLKRSDEENLCAVSLWVVSDLQTEVGRSLAYAAIKRLKHSNELRLGFIPNTAALSSGKVDINKAVYVAVKTLPNNLAKLFVTKLVKEENFKSLQSGSRTLADLEVNGMDMDAYLTAYDDQSDNFLKVYRMFVERVLDMEAGARAMITNGQVLGPIAADEEFLTEDIDLLEMYVKQQSAKNVKTTLKTLNIKGDKGSDLVMKIGGLLASVESSPVRKQIQFGSDRHSVVKIPGDPNSPAFRVEAIIDPASAEAQKLAPILLVLNQLYNLDIKIFMNSKEKLSEMPLKRYYRYVLDPELTFKADGSLTAGPSAKFTELPNKSILTLGMNPPESWLVESVRAQYDLDNILLEEVSSGVIADFDLEYLLLEGHCYDAGTGQPPRGLQFTLGTNNSDVLMDTIVMANLGYFQLKANPGVWNLQLRRGRSEEIYDVASHDFTDTPKGSKDVVVVMNNLKTKTIKIKVNKKPGMEREKLLDDSKETDKGIWDTISSSFAGDKVPGEKDETLNIFSVASGHLYERLLRIMMMGVLKNTKSKVKFWFLKNYLSPQFKDFIPHYAKEYGFEYELVQYKWPRWLNQQKEKQRIIWGYKILFLDVLFPLDVKKVIFVDADQIVRADLQELYDLDLGGAPYGYTPFCSDRTEMDGFRFWKSGYWASHLAGRSYHISALYVIDLKRFRQIAAGDRLRGQYQGLSQDPNSLSNLDQDLPNNMIHQVAIKSLPQEWLWCETWCSDESKKYAKTIDLCNNPMTKEPKLKAAMRIAPEWKNYDYEIKVFYDSIYGTNTRSQIEYEPPELSQEKKDAWRDRIEL